MSFLANFLLENDVSFNTPTIEVKNVTSSQKAQEMEGHLLVAGSVDWDNVNYGPRGLNELCRVDLSDFIVKNVYSSCSAHHAFIVLKDSGNIELLYSIGRNDFGQLGSGDKDSSAMPKKVANPAGNTAIKKIATGRYHSILLTKSGELFGCGASECGQLGLGATTIESNWKKIKTILPVVDVSCGYQFTVFCDMAGHVYTCGHPEYGQLGHGTTGEHFEEGKRKLQHQFITKPKRVEEFLVKDNKQKVTERIKYEDIHIVSVSAGRNHVLCLEANSIDHTTATVSSGSSRPHKGRVFSWGFGGYGRLGHNGTADELVPRLISTFDSLSNGGEYSKPMFRDSAVVQICAGNNASSAITRSGRLFLMGIVNHTTSKECNMYPKEVPSLMNCRVDSVSLGVSCIYVVSEGEVYAWGVSQSGVMGFADSKTAAAPKEVDLRGLEPLKVSCGHLHTCLLVKDRTAVPKAQMKTNKSSGSSSGGGKGKRPSPFAVMAEPTVCKFIAASQLKSYFPPLEILPELDPEVRKAKRQKKSKSASSLDDEKIFSDDEDEVKGEGKAKNDKAEGENYSNDDDESGAESFSEEEESSEEEEDGDVSEDDKGRARR